MVDTTLDNAAEMDDDTAEVNFLPPERFKRLLVEVLKSLGRISKSRDRYGIMESLCKFNILFVPHTSPHICIKT